MDDYVIIHLPFVSNIVNMTIVGDKMTWKLNKANDVECTMDNSGIYTIISRIEEKGVHKQYTGIRVSVRVDIMTDNGEPLQSFIGTADNVRKHVIRWIADQLYMISFEHASYIGAECERAEHEPHFVQR